MRTGDRVTAAQTRISRRTSDVATLVEHAESNQARSGPQRLAGSVLRTIFQRSGIPDEAQRQMLTRLRNRLATMECRRPRDADAGVDCFGMPLLIVRL